MKRIVEFLRSVTPSDPWQLLYLAGAVFLFLSPRLDWSFAALPSFGYIFLGLAPIVIAGIFAYLGCFEPGKRPLHRIALAVFLPTLLGFGLLIGESAFFRETNQSIFVHRIGLAAFLEECTIAFKEHPTGFLFALIALAMLAAFALRLYLGISSLPLRLGGSICSEDESAESWNRIQMLVFVLVCPLFMLSGFLEGLFLLLNWQWYRVSFSGFSLFTIFAAAGSASLLVLVAILILGKSGKAQAFSSLQLPPAKLAFLGLVLPVLIGLTISSLQFGYDRAQWAANGFGRISPPVFRSYFPLGEFLHWTLVLAVFAALAEEIIFRGMLLPSLLQRYGLHRGIFLTGLIWAAFHFHGDMHHRYSVAQALLFIASRVAICLAMNHVLSWMTLRANSVIPAAIAHTVSNVLIFGGLNGGVQFANEMRIGLWTICAVVLFRYWPVRQINDPETQASAPTPELAT